MTKAIRVHQPGGPEQMRWEDVEVGEPGPGQVRLRQTAVGLNFIDVYHRTGLYPQPLPFTPGVEGAGVVESVGPDVEGLKPGDRVAYAGAIGGYAEERLIAADRLVKLARRHQRRAGRGDDAAGHDGRHAHPLGPPAEEQATRSWSMPRRAGSG